MKHLILVKILCLCLALNGVTQNSNKLKFTSIAHVGLVAGANENALQVQTINGLAYKSYSAGVGFGLDYYYKRTVPLFVDVRKDLFKKKQTPFVYADLGTSFPWIKKDPDNSWWKNDYKRGLYYDVGVGYKLPLNKKFSVNVSFGYSEKKLGEHVTNSPLWFDYRPVDASYYNTQNDYRFRRWSLKMGLSF